MLMEVNFIPFILETSDPYICVEINSRRIFKSNQYTKDLNPVFDKEPVLGVLLNTDDLDVLQILIRDYNAFGTTVNFLIFR